MNETVTTDAKIVKRLFAKSESVYFLIPVFMILDIITTYIGLNYLGAVEHNPIIRSIAGTGGWVWMYFAMVVLFAYCLTLEMRLNTFKTNKYTKFFYTILLIIYAVVILNNSIVLIIGGW